MSSPSQSRAALRRTAGPLGRGVLGAPQALWVRRGRRAGGRQKAVCISYPLSAFTLLRGPQDFALVVTGDLNGKLVQI